MILEYGVHINAIKSIWDWGSFKLKWLRITARVIMKTLMGVPGIQWTGGPKWGPNKCLPVFFMRGLPPCYSDVTSLHRIKQSVAALQCKHTSLLEREREEASLWFLLPRLVTINESMIYLMGFWRNTCTSIEPRLVSLTCYSCCFWAWLGVSGTE